MIHLACGFGLDAHVHSKHGDLGAVSLVWGDVYFSGVNKLTLLTEKPLNSIGLTEASHFAVTTTQKKQAEKNDHFDNTSRNDIYKCAKI